MGETGPPVSHAETTNGGDLPHLKPSLSSRKAKAASVVSLASPFLCGPALGHGVRTDRAASLRSHSWFPGYSEDGGALRGEVIPEHEFATGPVRLDDENEFPPVSIRNP